MQKCWNRVEKTVTKVLKQLNKVFSSIKALKTLHIFTNIRYLAVGLQADACLKIICRQWLHYCAIVGSFQSWIKAIRAPPPKKKWSMGTPLTKFSKKNRSFQNVIHNVWMSYFAVINVHYSTTATVIFVTNFILFHLYVYVTWTYWY